MKVNKPVKLALPVCTGLVLIAAQFGLSSAALAADCPAVTVADMKGVPAGAFPQQYELAEFQSLAKCTLEFSGNPDAAALNKKIFGNPKLPSLAKYLATRNYRRLPSACRKNLW